MWEIELLNTTALTLSTFYISITTLEPSHQIGMQTTTHITKCDYP